MGYTQLFKSAFQAHQRSGCRIGCWYCTLATKLGKDTRTWVEPPNPERSWLQMNRLDRRRLSKRSRRKDTTSSRGRKLGT